MNKVCACIDGLTNSTAVIDWATWSARRLDVPLALLHALERDFPSPAMGDFSGALGFGAQESLLHDLEEIDEQRAKLAEEAGRRLLTVARHRVASAGHDRIETHLRHGALIDSVLDAEAEVRLFVMGEHHRASGSGRLHLDHRVERVIRSVKRPVLVVTTEQFKQPRRFVVAFDGSETARKMVEMIAKSPLLKGMRALLVTAGGDPGPAFRELGAARERLAQAGFETDVEFLPGEPETALPPLLKAQDDALLVMGAYGRSRIRELIVGSTTTTLLRVSSVPVLVLR